MEYLFWSNLTVWIFIFIYVLYLLIENRELNKKIESLKTEQKLKYHGNHEKTGLLNDK